MIESLKKWASLSFVLALLAGPALGLLSACETTEGFGRDVESAGDAIADEAEEHD